MEKALGDVAKREIKKRSIIEECNEKDEHGQMCKEHLSKLSFEEQLKYASTLLKSNEKNLEKKVAPKESAP